MLICQVSLWEMTNFEKARWKLKLTQFTILFSERRNEKLSCSKLRMNYVYKQTTQPHNSVALTVFSFFQPVLLISRVK